MGFDVYGKQPVKETGEYFRNNVWWWRPLWDFICEKCDDIISQADADGGTSNSGWLIDDTKAKAIAKRLEELVHDGVVKEYERTYTRELIQMPDVSCDICNGKGTRNDEVIQGKCNACGGLGHRRPRNTSYPFDAENVVQFIEFAKHSGGFTIC